ncbi:MAG: phosphonate metabolism protein/1,5-bisphosphokinase (PRPP-forming) PhnN [Rhizobiaceae bacterium]|nr:phosphonate metabolism protein/1,5-bisphosphokinase (PRPP-forming) PhnN [Rhizobiaceae bacterium]
MMASAMIEAEMASIGNPIGSGVFVAVVGPSGAGKDTVIAYARQALRGQPDFEFVRRVTTRPCDGATEDHDSLTEAAFDAADAAGAFALSWQAHGLKYGLPAGVDAAIADGRVAVANLSRAALPALRRRYAHVLVAEVTASPEILAERLAARGRESRDEVLSRLARAARMDEARMKEARSDVVRIDNGGSREAAGEKFVSLLRKALKVADVAGVC